MDSSGCVDSPRKSSTYRADDGNGEVVEQSHVNGSGYSPCVVSSVDTSDMSAPLEDFHPADEFLLHEGGDGESFISAGIEQSSSSGSQADREDEGQGGSSGENLHGLKCEETTAPVLPKSGDVRFRFVEGGGRVFEEEEPPPSTPVQDNPQARSGFGDTEDRNIESIRDISSADSQSLNGINVLQTGQNLPNNVQKLSERLSEPLGMAVATVLYEVLEQTGDFRTVASPADELSKLLEAALNESLFRVLGNERIVFVENFKSSFRSTYRTIRSVRKAYSDAGSRLTPSRQPYSTSWRGSPSKPCRISPNQAHRDAARRNFGPFYLEARKSAKVGAGGPWRKNAASRASNCEAESISEEQHSTSFSARDRHRDAHCDAACSSGQSCLNESLETSFFTFSSHEQDGLSDSVGSSSKSCLNESWKSSFFPSSNLEQDAHSDIAGSSSSMNSLNGSLSCQLSPRASQVRDVKTEHVEIGDPRALGLGSSLVSSTNSSERSDWVVLGRDDGLSAAPKHLQTEDSQDGEMFSATNSSESEWAVIGRDYAVSTAQRHMQNGEKEALTTYGKRSGEFVRNYSQGPLKGGGGGDAVPHTGLVGSSDGHTSSRVLQQGLTQEISRNSSHTVPWTYSSENSADSLPQAGRSRVVTLRPNSGRSENSFRTPEPSTNIRGLRRRPDGRRGADLFGKTRISHGRNGGNFLVQRIPHEVWEDRNQATGSSIEDNILLGIPNYRVTAENRTLLQRFVEAQEKSNDLKSLELAHNMKDLSLKTDHLVLLSESNILMRENVDLGRTKAELKEFELEDRKLTAAYDQLSRMCADELVAGLCVMLCALAYGAWKFSYLRLSRDSPMCQLPVRESHQTGWLGTNWVYNSLNAFTWQLQALTCEVTKAGRMLIGLFLSIVLVSALLCRSVTSSSQAMPATIIIVILAGICGFVGKISIDSLGGSGFHWVLLWELLCSLHLFATCCTPWLYKYLYGASSKLFQERASTWLKFCSITVRIFFHTLLVFAIPVMAGLLPFASIEELYETFWDSFVRH